MNYNWWKKFYKLLLDLIFPIKCLGCGKDDEWICSRCIKKIPIYQKPICLWCEMLSREVTLCPNCKKLSYLDYLFTITSYQTPLLQEILHNIKYKFAWRIMEDLKPLISRFLNQINIKNGLLVKNSNLQLIPVPLYRKRFLERGFNQSELLAQILNQIIPNAELVPNVLVRKKNTASQMTLNKKERIRNIQGAFKCNNQELIKNKRVLIIDDVLTTGSTIKEAALVLRKAGCLEVGALVLAKEELISKSKNGRVN